VLQLLYVAYPEVVDLVVQQQFGVADVLQGSNEREHNGRLTQPDNSK